MTEEQCPVWEYLDAGEALVTAAEWPGAIVLYQEGLKRYPDCPELHRALGFVQEQIGDSLGQWSSYQRAIELDAKQPIWVYTTLAYLLKQQGKFVEAIEVYQRVCSLDFLGSLENPGNLNPLILGDFEESWDAPMLGDLEEVERRELGFEVGRHLGECWTELGEIAEAIAAYERALQLEPERLWVKHRMGALRFRWGLQLLEAGQVAEAVGQFEQIDQVQDQQGTLIPWFEARGMRWPWMRSDWMQQFELEKPEGQEWPCITVVTPSLNQGDYLEETILSVLNQQYPNLDYVIVDGGSRDQTPEILQRYRDRVAAVIVEADGGQSEAINKGMGQARGELLLWVNSDDLLAPGALHWAALTYLRQGSEVIAGICLVHEQGRVVGMRRPRVRQADFTVAHLADVGRLWSTGHFFFQPEVVFSRALWERVGGRLDESLHYAMDHDLWMRFAAAGASLTVVGYPFALFRQHERQKTANRMASMQELVQVTERYHQVVVRQARQEEIGQRIRRLLQMKQPRLLVVCGQVDQRFDPDYRDFTWQNGHQQYHIQVCATLANVEVALFDAILLLVNEDESTLFKQLGRLKYNGLRLAWYEQIHFNDGFSLQLAAAVDVCIPMQIGIQKILKSTESVVLDCLVPGITEWTDEAATERLQQQDWAESAQLPIVSCVRDPVAIETAFSAALTQFGQDGFAGRFRRHCFVVSQHLWTHHLEQIVEQLWDWVEALEAANGVRGMVMKMQRSVWDYLDAGKVLVKAAKWTEAIALYQEAIGQHPDRAELHRALGVAQEKVGDSYGERLSYQRVIELEPGQPQWVYGTLGHLLTDQQQWQQAIEVYWQGLARYPEQASFYRYLGLAQEHLGEVVAEIASYRRAIELEPQPVWVYETLLELLVQQGDAAGAIAIGQLGLAQYPEQVALQKRVVALQREGQVLKNGSAVSEERPEPMALVSLEAYVERAKQLTEQERFQEAIEVYQEAIGQHLDRAFLYRELGIIQEKVGDIDGEIESYRKAVSLEEQPPWVYCTLAALLIKQGINIHDSISHLSQAIQLDPGDPNIYCWLGKAYLQIGEFGKAVEVFKKTIVLNPNILGIHEYLGDALTGLSKQYTHAALASYEQARIQRPDQVALYEKSLELDAENASLYIELGNLFFKNEAFGHALACYRVALQLEPGSPEIYLLMAKVMEAQNNLHEAAECCRRALLMNPHEWRYGYELGLIEVKQGHLEKALEYLIQACHLNNSSADLYTAIGSVYFALERWNDSINAYYKAVELDSKQGFSYKRLGDLLSRQGKYQEASLMYKKSVEFGFQESNL